MQNGLNLREDLERLERENLSPYASLSMNANRQRPADKCAIRTEFQRDRDKILHSKSFRRLKHKTQVFIAPEGDHYRTRLTHTLEVMQIGRTIARALRLNEDLTEAIAMGHDLGHTPFGHSGENVLNDVIYKAYLKSHPDAAYHKRYFEHNTQSLRVVDVLENGRGLNLTNEVRDGIAHHSGDQKPYTLEGKIVHMSDRIAYINHDIDDAIRAGVIKMSDLPAESLKILGFSHKERINNMILNIINNSVGKNDIIMSQDVKQAMAELRTFMFEHVYIGSAAKQEEIKAQKLIEMLFYYYEAHPEKLPDDYCKSYQNTGNIQPIVDYIAGMTDHFAIKKFKEYFVPNAWNLF